MLKYCETGRGIALIPMFIAGEALHKGILRAVLRDYSAPPLTLYAIYPPTRHLSVNVRFSGRGLRTRQPTPRSELIGSP
jgi:DNA-binding transcriptional LysR family regulator